MILPSGTIWKYIFVVKCSWFFGPLDVIKRREQVKNHIALSRAKETEQERASRRKGDKERKAASRAKGTDLEKADHRKSAKSIILWLSKTTVS